MQNPEKTIGNIIDKVTVSVISSADIDGFPNSNAMFPPRKCEGIKHIYFTTNTSSMRVQQYSGNPKACVYFFGKRFFKGGMLKGTMEVLTDAKSKKMIWRDSDEMDYQKGTTAPDFCVLKFTSQNSRCYSSFKSENFEVE